MELKEYRTDSSKENHGVWVAFMDGEIKIRPLNNPDYLKHYREATRSWARLGAQVPEDKLEAILVDCLADTVLMDWHGFTEDGAECPYSKEKAREYLSFFRFRADVMEEASKLANFREDAAKN